MGFASVGSLLTGSDITNGQTMVLNTSVTLEVGNLGVIVVGTENFGSENVNAGDDPTGEPTNHHQSLTDALGNEYVKWCEFANYINTQGAAGAISIWTVIPKTAITTADDITLTLRGTTTRKAVTGWEYTYGGGPLSMEAFVREAFTTGAPSALSLANMPSREYLLVHGLTLETNSGNFTADGDYTAMTTVVGDTGTLSTSIQTSGEFRIATLTGDTAGPTVDTEDFAQVMVAFFEGEPTRPVHVGSSVSANTSTGGSVVWPPHEIGDVAILAFETQSEPITLGTPAGFQHVPGSPFDEGTDTEMSIFWNRATVRNGMATPAYDDAGDHVLGKMHLFRGCINYGNPWDVIASDVLATPSTTLTVPGATTTKDQALVLLLWTVDIVPTSVYLPDANSDLTELTRLSQIRSGGGGGGVGLATGYRSVAGSIAATTFTVDSTSQARVLIALKPNIVIPGFSPYDVSGLIVWLKADALNYADNDRVLLWRDSGPVGNDFVETIVDISWDSPTFQTNELNGFPIVRFNDGFEGMTGPAALSIAKPYTIFYVAKYNDVDSQSRRILNSLDTNWLMGPYSGFWQQFAGSFSTAGPDATDGNWIIHGLRDDTGAGTVYVWDLDTEDAPFSTARAGAGVLQRPALGRGSSNEPAESDLAELIIYDTELSDTDRDAVVAYLRLKWGNVTPAPPSNLIQVQIHRQRRIRVR